jgi:hypothetical protein
METRQQKSRLPATLIVDNLIGGQAEQRGRQLRRETPRIATTS